MRNYDEATYGARIADIYDELYPVADDACITCLAQLAGPGPALELGIGTGRVALSLLARGIEVHGIDVSPEMVQHLRAKEGGAQIPVTLGSFADFALPKRFRLVYIVFNTFFALLTQEEQIRCFQSVARHLHDDGVFLIEAFVPDLTRYDRDQTVSAIRIESHRVMLDVAQLDRAAQQITVQHVFLSEDGLRLFPVKLRYAYPSELDLMARLAGMRLRARWSSWDGAPFTSGSSRHISLYERSTSTPSQPQT